MQSLSCVLQVGGEWKVMSPIQGMAEPPIHRFPTQRRAPRLQSPNERLGLSRPDHNDDRTQLSQTKNSGGVYTYEWDRQQQEESFTGITSTT